MLFFGSRAYRPFLVKLAQYGYHLVVLGVCGNAARAENTRSAIKANSIAWHVSKPLCMADDRAILAGSGD